MMCLSESIHSGPAPLPGVYAIINSDNGMVYIGSSVNISHRLRIHRCELRSGRHQNWRLQKAYDTSGEAAFHAMVIERVSPHLLISAELAWINGYGGGLYNISMPRLGTFTHSQETMDKIVARQRAYWSVENNRSAHSARLTGRRCPGKRYHLISPHGVPFIGENRAQFCKETGLSPGHVSSLISGRLGSHKGWTIPGNLKNIGKETT
jgi:hypothetical protein